MATAGPGTSADLTAYPPLLIRAAPQLAALVFKLAFLIGPPVARSTRGGMGLESLNYPWLSVMISLQ